MTTLAPLPKFQFLSNGGVPLAGGKLFTYAAGTTTKLATFTDVTGGTPNADPIILDAFGRCDCWLDPTKSYKFVLSPSTDTDPPTSPIWTVDNITPQQLTSPWAIAGGSADAITCTYAPVNFVLTDGLLLGFRALLPNATATPSFSPDSLTPHTITKQGGSALAAGDIPGALAECFVRYNLANTRWELLNPASNGMYKSTQVFTANGTYTAPPGLKRVRVTVVGGGGGAGGIDATGVGQVACSGGAGGAGTAVKTISAATVGASQAVTVGAAGVGGVAGVNNGGTGGTSSFGALVSATGGAGSGGGGASATNSANNGAQGGVGSGGDYNLSGGAGVGSFCEYTIPFANAGIGGASHFGGGGLGGFSSVGLAGGNYGGGAGGSASYDSTAARAGANGGPGIVIVEEFF